MATKSRTLTVQVTAQVDIDYDPSELEAMGKSFREFKLGVERTIKDDLLPNFARDPHTTITLGTLAYPTTKKRLKMQKGGHAIMESK